MVVFQRTTIGFLRGTSARETTSLVYRLYGRSNTKREKNLCINVENRKSLIFFAKSKNNNRVFSIYHYSSKGYKISTTPSSGTVLAAYISETDGAKGEGKIFFF